MSKIRSFFKALPAWISANPLPFVLIITLAIIVFTFGCYKAIEMTSTPTFCGQCHTSPPPSDQYYTWAVNVHAKNNVLCLDCHTPQPGMVGYFRSKMRGMVSVYYEVTASDEKIGSYLSAIPGNPERSEKSAASRVCMHCHTDQVNSANRNSHFMTFFGVAMRDLDRVQNPQFREMFGLIDILTTKNSAGVDPNHVKHIQQTKLNCSHCHKRAAHSGEFGTLLIMQNCFACHDEVLAKNTEQKPVANDGCITCHVGQKALQEGVAAAEFGVAQELWFKANDFECTDCHESTFKVSARQSCIGCHGEEDGYADLVDKFQENYITNYASANEFYMENLPNRKNMTAEKRKLFNEYAKLFGILKRDMSKGFHNPDYVTMIFERMEEIRAEY